MPHVNGLAGHGGNHSWALSKGQKRLKREWEREHDHIRDGHKTRLNLDEGLLQWERPVSNVP